MGDARISGGQVALIVVESLVQIRLEGALFELPLVLALNSFKIPLRSRLSGRTHSRLRDLSRYAASFLPLNSILDLFDWALTSQDASEEFVIILIVVRYAMVDFWPLHGIR